MGKKRIGIISTQAEEIDTKGLTKKQAERAKREATKRKMQEIAQEIREVVGCDPFMTISDGFAFLGVSLGKKKETREAFDEYCEEHDNVKGKVIKKKKLEKGKPPTKKKIAEKLRLWFKIKRKDKK